MRILMNMSDASSSPGPRDRSVKMLDVAAAAGVSRSTVSNVMRGHASVAADVRARVLDEAERLGYVYNRGAAGLRMRQSHLVGLVVPDLANPFIGQAVLGIQESLSARGYLVVAASTGDQLDRQAIVLRTLGEHRVDGFLLIPAIASNSEGLLTDLGGLPAVLVNRDVEQADVEHVGPDDRAVGRLGADHLINVHG
ncbi:MAG: transcriptional regulator, LacI family, partial [Glaciihabitans sp.]|nr:transcriptional regulator, LacI family [Glaciihabitans sp.]